MNDEDVTRDLAQLLLSESAEVYRQWYDSNEPFATKMQKSLKQTIVIWDGMGEK